MIHHPSSIIHHWHQSFYWLPTPRARLDQHSCRGLPFRDGLTRLKCEFMGKRRFYKSVIMSKINFSKLCKKKITCLFFRGFLRKNMSRIFIFLALKPSCNSSTIWDKIRKLLLSFCYPTPKYQTEEKSHKELGFVHRFFLFSRNLVDCNKVDLGTQWNLVKRWISVTCTLSKEHNWNFKGQVYGRK